MPEKKEDIIEIIANYCAWCKSDEYPEGIQIGCIVVVTENDSHRNICMCDCEFKGDCPKTQRISHGICPDCLLKHYGIKK